MVIRGHNRNVNEESLGKRGEGDGPMVPHTAPRKHSSAREQDAPQGQIHGQGVSTHREASEGRAQGAQQSNAAPKNR